MYNIGSFVMQLNLFGHLYSMHGVPHIVEAPRKNINLRGVSIILFFDKWNFVRVLNKFKHQ